MSYAMASPGALQRGWTPRRRRGLGATIAPAQLPVMAIVNGKIVQTNTTVAQQNQSRASAPAAASPAASSAQKNYAAASPASVTPQNAPAKVAAAQAVSTAKTPAAAASPAKVVPPQPVGVQSSYDAQSNTWTVLGGPVGSQPYGTGIGPNTPAPTYAGAPVDKFGNVVYVMQGPNGTGILAGGTPSVDAAGTPQIYSYDPALKDQYASSTGVTSQQPTVSLSQLAATAGLPGTTKVTSPGSPNYVNAPPSQVTPSTPATPSTPVTNVPPGVPLTAPECPYLPGCPGYPGTSGGGGTDVNTGAGGASVGSPAVSCPPPPTCPTGQYLTIDANGCYSICSGDASTGDWFTDPTQELIPNIPNWVTLAGGALAAYLMLRRKSR